jgi:hypothetical protein
VRALLGKAAAARIAASKGPRPLLRTIESGQQEAAQLLLGKGAELDRRSSAGNTALMLASQAGLLEVVRALIKRGAAADLRSEQGYTALMLASAVGPARSSRRCSRRADRGLRNKRRQTAVDIANASGQSAVMEPLQQRRPLEPYGKGLRQRARGAGHPGRYPRRIVEEKIAARQLPTEVCVHTHRIAKAISCALIAAQAWNG